MEEVAVIISYTRSGDQFLIQIVILMQEYHRWQGLPAHHGHSTFGTAVAHELFFLIFKHASGQG